jgi:nucleoside transporter
MAIVGEPIEAKVGHAWIRTRLSALMFLEFFIFGAWVVPASGYLNSVLGFTGTQIGWVFATLAIGAIVSPVFVGYVADRFFATEMVLAALLLGAAVGLALAAEQTKFPGLFAFFTVSALCFMPTLPLVNSLCFQNIPDANRFSRIAVWGTIGWIASGLIIGFLLKDQTKYFLYLAGAAAALLAIYCLTLPHTPPKARQETGDVLGFGATRVFGRPATLVFAASIALVTVVGVFYLTWGNAFLNEIQAPRPTALMTLSQASEIVVMIIMPWVVVRLGLKKVLVLGVAAWMLRYFLFASQQLPLIVAGLLLHGFCYCFTTVAAFIYTDRIAPPGMSARAQSLLAFLLYGVATFLGSQLAGLTAQQYSAAETALMKHDWTGIWMWPAGLALATCMLFLILGSEPTAEDAAPGESFQEAVDVDG